MKTSILYLFWLSFNFFFRKHLKHLCTELFSIFYLIAVKFLPVFIIYLTENSVYASHSRIILEFQRIIFHVLKLEKRKHFEINFWKLFAGIIFHVWCNMQTSSFLRIVSTICLKFAVKAVLILGRKWNLMSFSRHLSS